MPQCFLRCASCCSIIAKKYLGALTARGEEPPKRSDIGHNTVNSFLKKAMRVIARMDIVYISYGSFFNAAVICPSSFSDMR